MPVTCMPPLPVTCMPPLPVTCMPPLPVTCMPPFTACCLKLSYQTWDGSTVDRRDFVSPTLRLYGDDYAHSCIQSNQHVMLQGQLGMFYIRAAKIVINSSHLTLRLAVSQVLCEARHPGDPAGLLRQAHSAVLCVSPQCSAHNPLLSCVPPSAAPCLPSSETRATSVHDGLIRAAALHTQVRHRHSCWETCGQARKVRLDSAIVGAIRIAVHS
jgi:hypothetical protein